MKRIHTLCIIYNSRQILLGMKKRGFGSGRWNGFGGKVRNGESIEDAALRETQEEIRIIPHSIARRGLLLFHITDNNLDIEVHLFSASEYIGEPRETEEMKPKWFNLTRIPYDDMWPDDRYWLPKLLNGKNLRGEFWFHDINTLTRYTVTETV